MICERCGGGGKFPHLKHIDNGKCFKCDGKGFVLGKGEIAIEYLNEKKDVIDVFFCDSSTTKRTVIEKGKKLSAHTFRAYRGR